MEASDQRRIIEALILASPEPISLARLAQIVPDLTPGDAKDRINELNTEYAEQDRAFEVWEVAGGFQIRTRAEFSGYLQQLRRERPLRLSKAALETLSVIAYKQPATRGEIEAVRGVDSGAVVKSLLERKLVRIVGHREVPGRPLLYGTSRRFLEIFGLESIKKLPNLRELEELAREQGVQLPGMGDEPTDAETEAETGADVDAAAEETLERADDAGLADDDGIDEESESFDAGDELDDEDDGPVYVTDDEADGDGDSWAEADDDFEAWDEDDAGDLDPDDDDDPDAPTR